MSGIRWDLTLDYAFLRATPFFSVQVMLLGFVLLGRSLEERARVKASSDMNELLVSFNQSYVVKHCNACINLGHYRG